MVLCGLTLPVGGASYSLVRRSSTAAVARCCSLGRERWFGRTTMEDTEEFFNRAVFSIPGVVVLNSKRPSPLIARLPTSMRNRPSLHPKRRTTLQTDILQLTSNMRSLTDVSGMCQVALNINAVFSHCITRFLFLSCSIQFFLLLKALYSSLFDKVQQNIICNLL